MDDAAKPGAGFDGSSGGQVVVCFAWGGGELFGGLDGEETCKVGSKTSL